MNPNPLVQPIAIVGLAVEIPSGLTSKNNLNHDTFFEFLLNKDQAYQEFPSERFNVESGPNLGQVVTNTGCFLKDILLFDPVEFGITLKDAKAMAVATRKLIETTFLALLDSGIDYRGRNVGCYMSAVALETLSIAHADIYEPRGSFAGYPYMVANKVSYHLDLLGPSVPVDTACSSTMTGLHLAVQALRSGKCLLISVQFHPLISYRLLDFIQYSQGGVLAPDGKCKPFDISADGFSRGEGVGSIVLKPLDAAIRDGDYIYASILGTGINSTGAAGPVSAPVAEAQMDAMHRAYTGTGRQPSEVDYIELHATGTAAGDPTQANWVGSEFRRDSELLVGSVKGNIGHLEIMSFLASVSKVCSIFKSRIIPPTVNLNVPNPAILWEKHKMRAPVDCTPFNPRHPSGQGLVSMCSSGIGGSNGHAILEGPPVPVSKDRGDHQNDIPILFIASGLSARSAAAVGETLESIMLDAPPTLSALSNIYGRRARQMSWRSTAVYVPNQVPVRFPTPRFSPRQKRPIVFVFSGQGPQYFEMGRQLFEHYTIFRHSIEQMDQIYVEATGKSLIRSTGLFVDDPTPQNLSDMWPVSVTLPALAMLQMALCDLLAAAGVVPDVVIGHSAGETSAMHACGAATQATALRLAIARGIAMSAVEGAGSMAAINCSSSAAESLIAEVLGTIPSDGPGGVLEIACYNAHDSVALSGTSDLIDRAVTLAKDRGFLARKLRTNVPFHSSLLEPTKEQYEKSLRLIFDGNAEHRPGIPTYSSFTGQLWQGSFSAEYFWSNTRMPVLFSQGISALLQDIPKPTFLELGPHPVLQSYISSFDASLPILAPMRRPKLAEGFHEVRMLLSAIGELVVHGCNLVDLTTFTGSTTSGVKLSTPPYPFSRKPVSYEPDSSAVLATARTRKGPLNDFNLGLNSLTHPALAQHIIRNEPIMPAAGYLEMAFEFDVRYLWNVRFDSILPLLPDRVLRVQVSQEGHLWSVRSWTSGSELNYFARRPPRLHAQGYMSRLMPQKWENLDLDAIRNRCQVLDIGGFYQQIAYFAQYGKAYQRVTGCYIADSEGLIRVRGSEEDLTNEGDYHLHPVILDSCLHALVHPAFTRNSDTSVYYLPSYVEAVTLHTSFRGKKLPATLYAYAKIREWDPEFLCWDLSITDAGGLRICTLIGLRVSIHSISAHVRSEIRYKLVYQPKANQQHATFPGRDLRIELGVLDDSALSRTCLALFHAALNTIFRENRKRVIRLLVVHASSSSFETSVDEQVNAPESVLVDFTFAAIEKDNAQPTPQKSSEYHRKIHFDPGTRPEAQGLTRSTFDVILAFDLASYLHEPSAFMENMMGLLQPGGYLILGQGLERKPPSLGGDAKVPNIEPGAYWQQLALTHFPRAHLYPIPDASSVTVFALGAQKPSWPALPWNSANISRPLIIEFTLENILHCQQTVRECDSVTLWISATADRDNGAALGFSRSLRREMVSCEVFLVLFDPVWLPEARLSIIGDLSGTSDVEAEVCVDAHGHVYVPRIVRSPDVADKCDFDSNSYWVRTPEAILQVSPPAVPAHHVLVRVTKLSSNVHGLRVFVGHISNAGCTPWSTQELVLGAVASEQIGNHFVVHEGQIVPAVDHVQPELAAAFIFLAMAVGIDFIRNPARLQGRRFLITDADEPMGGWLTTILSSLGVIPETTSVAPTEVPRETVHLCHVILSGYSSPDDLQVLQSHMNADALVRWWNGPTTSQEMSLLDLPLPSNLDILCSSPEEYLSLAVEAGVKIHASLFEADKSYLLIGGIGSLGLRIAWWMYQKGARHLILTSRSGEASLNRDRNTAAIRLLTYLRAIPDLSLRLEGCDAASASATSDLVNSAFPRVGGCILLGVVFSDRAFLSHTVDSFYIPFAAKSDAFRALEHALPINSLDFLLVLSSVTGLFGSLGQTNYSGANTAVDALAQAYPRAFSIVAPAILDSHFLINQKNLSSDSRFKTWTSWGITSQQLCDCIEHAIFALNQGTSDNMYLPEVSWEEIKNQLGVSPMYDHFLEGTQDVARDDPGEHLRLSVTDTVRQIVLKTLDVDTTEFSIDTPFTSYGLDSLSAGRLLFMLRPYLSITQVQLLADMTLTDVYQRIEQRTQVESDAHVNEGRFDWNELNQSGQTVVVLVEGEGIPLIVIHGSSGNIGVLFPLQERFSSPLWAIQTTPETPMDSLEEMARFYFQEIKAVRPVGPYRFAGVSGCSIVMFHLALLFERNGDHVVQLVNLDHFPTLYALPELFRLDEETATNKAASRALVVQSFDHLRALYERDLSPSRRILMDDLAKAFEGLPVREFVRLYHEVFVKIVTMIARFALELSEGNESGQDLKVRMERWMSQVKAPVTTIVAKDGFVRSIPIEGWEDLGSRACFSDAKVILVDSGHFAIYEMDEVVDEMQYGW
ncbi:putative polyketide synthase [Mycena polygramma]|nr:putative polyketide synthase [Mycena polygramma]